jgi:CheY-like chemotaxis protein
VIQTPRADAEAPSSVVVLEPSSLFRNEVTRVCCRHGLTVVAAEDVAAALAQVTRRRPAAVIAACELPGPSGHALVAAMRRSPGLQSIPIALTTSGLRRAQPQGLFLPDRTILKDRDFAAGLAAFLSGLARETRGSAHAAPGAGLAARLDARILLAEDCTMIQKLISHFLHSAGAVVTIVENGQEAVAAVRSAPFDLVLMDLEMPVMNGWQATRRLRSDKMHMPIVALTAHADAQTAAEAIALGFDAVFIKPIQRDLLVGRCLEVLAAHAAAAAPPNG